MRLTYNRMSIPENKLGFCAGSHDYLMLRELAKDRKAIVSYRDHDTAMSLQVSMTCTQDASMYACNYRSVT